MEVVKKVVFLSKVKDSRVDHLFDNFVNIGEERDWPVIACLKFRAFFEKGNNLGNFEFFWVNTCGKANISNRRKRFGKFFLHVVKNKGGNAERARGFFCTACTDNDTDFIIINMVYTN